MAWRVIERQGEPDRKGYLCLDRYSAPQTTVKSVGCEIERTCGCMSVCRDMDIDVGVGGACVCSAMQVETMPMPRNDMVVAVIQMLATAIAGVMLVILVINAKARAKDYDGTVLTPMPKVWLMRPCFGYVQVIMKHPMTRPTQWDSVLRLLVGGLIVVEPAPR